MKEPPPNQKCECLCLAYAKAYAESHPLECLEMLAKRLNTVIEIRSLRLDIIGTRAPAKYAPDGVAYRLNARIDRDPPKLVTREEAEKVLKEASGYSKPADTGEKESK